MSTDAQNQKTTEEVVETSVAKTVTESQKEIDLTIKTKVESDINADFNLDDFEEQSNIVPKEGGNHVKIESFEVVNYEEDKWAVDITYIEDETGNTLRQRLFEPKRPKDIRDKSERKMTINNIAAFKHFFNSLYPLGKESEGIIWNDTISFVDFIKSFSKGIDPNYKNLKAKLKVIYRKGQSFPSVAGFPPFIFTENSNKKGDFVYSKDYDHLTPQSKEPQNETGDGGGSASGASKDNWL